MSSTEPLKVFPTAEELQSASEYYCSEEVCRKSGIKFKNMANLDMHLTRHHKLPPKVDKSDVNIVRQFHCPIVSCTYHVDASKGHSFRSRKYLKQHFLKVHATKSFECCVCQKKFSTVVLRENHERTCGNYQCSHCHYSYKSKESLSSHVRRKHNGNVSTSGLKRNRLKGVQKKDSAVPSRSNSSSTNEIGVQTTDPIVAVPEQQIHAATLTVTEEEDNRVTDSLVDNYCQTMTYLDEAFGCFNATSGSSTGGAMLSIETQTDLLDDLSLMSSIYNSNDRHTQTCEEILNELLVNDIETQTMWSGITADCATDFSVSTETQTLFGGVNTSIQTQTTDVLFGETSTSSTQT